ncbi:uncharacterized protein LOC119161957 isoform X1 [Rhipicephalus microplus]|uniref:uncharacterized protein LOC119161957 isoform X1 n=1 Tax=Rhipicephalus microplus TaxID=6941 RepID=UPI003F6BD520
MDDDILGAGSRLLAASANTIVDGLKKYLRPVSPDSLPLPKDTKSLFDFDKDDSFSPVPQSVEPSIVIFRGATGLVTDITDFGGTIEVQDQACSVGSLKVNFLSGVFYSNGVGCTKRLCEVLGCGDVVSLDFMVGSNGGHEEVWCDLVWQGARPQGVIQMSPEDFCRQLQIKVPARHGGPSYEDFQLELRRATACPRTQVYRTASTYTGEGATTVRHPSRQRPAKLCRLRHQGAFTGIVPFHMASAGTVLRRVARMMAEELHALQHQERLAKGSVRDVATQTTERGVHSVP